MIKLSRGLLVALEGIDGSGKTTLAHLLYQKLTDTGFPAVLTKEPGGTEIGKHIRTILQHFSGTLYPNTEYLLFAADRAQHMQEYIIPALKQNTIVISDRMADSSYAYQGYGRGVDIGMITATNRWVMQGVEPDLVLYLALDPEHAQARRQARGGELHAFDREQREFFERVTEGFQQSFQNRLPVITLDATQHPEALLAQAEAAIHNALQGSLPHGQAETQP